MPFVMKHSSLLKAIIVKINPKHVLLLFLMTIIFTIIPGNIALADASQNVQTAAAIDEYSWPGAARGVGIWILFTLVISLGLNNHIRKREKKVEKF